MFRSIALTLALVLSAGSVAFVTLGKAADEGRAILPALPVIGDDATGFSEAPGPERWRVHTVSIGQTLSSIARVQ